MDAFQSQAGNLLQAQAVVTVAVKRVTEFNRRTLDAIAARLYFYLSLTHEHSGTLSDIRRWVLLCHALHNFSCGMPHPVSDACHSLL